MLAKHFDVVLIDASGKLNFLARVSKDRLAEMASDMALRCQSLDDTIRDGVDMFLRGLLREVTPCV